MHYFMAMLGTPVVAELGGLHSFMNWKRNLLTDSGGFQMVILTIVSKRFYDRDIFIIIPTRISWIIVYFIRKGMLDECRMIHFISTVLTVFTT